MAITYTANHSLRKIDSSELQSDYPATQNANMEAIDAALPRQSVVSALPSTGETGVLYLVKKGNGSEQNRYYEYIWIAADSQFERLG